MPKIANLITPHSVRVEIGANLGDAAALMAGEKISSVIVMDGHAILGIITERDIMRAMRQHRSLTQPVSALMTTPVHTVPDEMDFRTAYREASALGIRHLVVVDRNGAPLGVASETQFRHHLGPDFFRHLNDVSSLMERGYPSLPGNATLDEALSAMDAVRASCVLVSEDQRTLGIITERDIVRLFLGGRFNPLLVEAMTSPVICIGENQSLAEAAEALLTHGIRHLVVVNAEGHTVGTLSEHTLMRPLELDLLDDALSERLSLIRSRDQALATTARKERYQQALLDNFPFLVWLKDTESRFLASNRELAKLVGKQSPDELIGLSDLDFFPPELAERYRQDDTEVLRHGLRKTTVEPILRDGQPVWHETYKAPVFADDGSLLGTVGFAQDISVRQRSQEAMLLRNAALSGLIRGEALTATLELFVLAVETEMPDSLCAIQTLDASGRYLQQIAAPRLPPAFCASIDGMPVDTQARCSSRAACLHERVITPVLADAAAWQPYLALAEQSGIAACWAEPIIGPDGQLLGVVSIYRRIPGIPDEQASQQLIQASQMAALILSHHHNAENLRQSQETFHGIFHGINEALVILDQDGRLLDANLSAAQLANTPREAMIGQYYHSLAAPGLNDLAGIKMLLAEALTGTPQYFEFWLEDRQRRLHPCEIRLQAGHYFGQAVLIASAIDISERKSTEIRREIEHDLSNALANNLDRNAVLNRILQAALRLPELEAGSIYWRGAEDHYTLAAAENLSPAFTRQLDKIYPQDPLAALVHSPDANCGCNPPCPRCAESDLLDEPLIRAEGFTCLVILPLVVNDQVIACLNLGGRRTTQVSPETMTTLESVAHNFSHTLLRLEAQAEARQRQDNLSGLFDTLTDLIIIIDQQGRILHCNSAVTEHLGYPRAKLIGQAAHMLHPKELAGTTERMFSEILNGQRTNCRLPMQHANGHRITVETRVTRGHWNGQPAFIGITQDITERVIAEERQNLAASVFDNAHEGIMITDPAGRILEVNATFSELTGYSRAEAIGSNADLLKSGHHNAIFYEEMWQVIREKGYWRGEVWNRKKTGEIFVEQLTISTVRNREGEISNFVGIFSDITLLKEHQQHLERLAHFDALTQLPNRMLLADRMHLAMSQTERSGKLLAVCYLDLDGFKPVNDTYGHATGDHLLIEVAHRLRHCVRAGDTVARLGGDEFVLLLSSLEDLHECNTAMARVIATLAQPFPLNGADICISASIGVTLYPHDGADSDALLRHADQAMYAAKQAGRNRFHLFDPENDRRARIRRDEISAICQGIINQEFVLYYQPKVDMRKGRVIGAEALIRWQHPERGLLPPGEFLPAIEGSELAIELGDWVLREALQQLETWFTAGLSLSISVNVAGNHLQTPSFARRLGELLALHPSVPPGLLELEVLETAALEDISSVARLFAECRRLGVSFALDDFGTGYSSLTYFRRLPAEVLKIDQSFVRDMLDDADDLAIVEGVIGLTQAFQRKVIAEGVETAEHGLVLLQLGCDMAQGYGIARPMPAANLPHWIEHFQPDELWNSVSTFNWSREDLPLMIAAVEHKRWKQKLHAYLADSSGALLPPSDNEHACRFGRWYYGEQSKRYAHIEGFTELGLAHTRLHRLGEELIKQHTSNASADKTMLMSALNEQTEIISRCIHQIQVEILISNQAGAIPGKRPGHR